MPDRMTEKQFRWTEMLLMAFVSCIGSIATAAFILRGYIAKIEDNSKAITAQTSEISSLKINDAKQNIDMAVLSTQYGNIQLSLNEIKGKLERGQ